MLGYTRRQFDIRWTSSRIVRHKLITLNSTALCMSRSRTKNPVEGQKDVFSWSNWFISCPITSHHNVDRGCWCAPCGVHTTFQLIAVPHMHRYVDQPWSLTQRPVLSERNRNLDLSYCHRCNNSAVCELHYLIEKPSTQLSVHTCRRVLSLPIQAWAAWRSGWCVLCLL